VVGIEILKLEVWVERSRDPCKEIITKMAEANFLCSLDVKKHNLRKQTGLSSIYGVQEVTYDKRGIAREEER
jgi:hypothetical protein